MKKLLALILALVMVLSMAACGNNGTPAEATKAPATPEAPAETTPATTVEVPASKVEVAWWTYYGDTNIGYCQTVIDAFNESQDKYFVTIHYQGSQSEMNAKIQATTKDQLPAMFSGAVENVAMYDAADFCANMQSFVDADTVGWEELEGTWAAIRAAYSDTEGKLVGYPMGYSYGGVFYNEELLAEAGIDPATLTSYPAIYEASKKLVEGGYCTYGVGFHNDGFYPTAAIGREGLMAYNNNNGYSSERITECLYLEDASVNNAVYEMLDAYQKLHAEKLCVPYGSNYQSEIIPQIAAGECAMMIGVVSMTTKILDAVGGQFTVGIVPQPSCTEAGKRTGEPAGGTGNFICDNGNAEQMQGAYEFIKFASTADQAAYFAVSTGYLAPNSQSYNAAAYQDFLNNTWPAVSVVYDSLAASDDSANNPYIPISNEMKAANKLMIETVSSDPNADIASVIGTAYESIQEAIELYNMSNP